MHERSFARRIVQGDSTDAHRGLPGGLRANYGERLGWPLPPPLAWNARTARCASSGAAIVGRLAKQDRRGALTG